MVAEVRRAIERQLAEGLKKRRSIFFG